jgi:hypothetical protein
MKGFQIKKAFSQKLRLLACSYRQLIDGGKAKLNVVLALNLKYTRCEHNAYLTSSDVPAL